MHAKVMKTLAFFALALFLMSATLIAGVYVPVDLTLPPL